ncbi:Dual specificity protein kinase TTK [Nymphon striatum]|nr:Dual specificity protein kinase TTK [Nymphon striatum]
MEKTVASEAVLRYNIELEDDAAVPPLPENGGYHRDCYQRYTRKSTTPTRINPQDDALMDPRRDKENILPSSINPKTGLPYKTELSYAPQPMRKFGKEIFVKPSAISSQCSKSSLISSCASSSGGLTTIAEVPVNVSKGSSNSSSVFISKFDCENKSLKLPFSSNKIGYDDDDDDLPKSPELSSEFSLSCKLREDAKYQSVNKAKIDSGFSSALKNSGTRIFLGESTPSYPEKNVSSQDTGTYLYDGKNTTAPESRNKALEPQSNEPVSEMKRNLRHCQSTPDCKQGSHISESRAASNGAFSSHMNNVLSRMHEFKKPVAIPRRPFLFGSTLKLNLDLDESLEEHKHTSEDEHDEIAEVEPEWKEESYSNSTSGNQSTIDCSANQSNRGGHDLNYSSNEKYPSHPAKFSFSTRDTQAKKESKREVGVGSPHIEMRSQSVQTEPTERTIFVNGIFYTVMSQIGRGGSSVVYEGKSNKNGKMVAIKQVSLAKADKSIRESYVNEINLLKKLNGSDRVITLYDYEYNDKNGILNVVMEKGELDLQTLIRNIGESGKLRDYELQYYWMQMLEAVQVVHEAGIIHSDLKPANFVIAKGRLKLIDFGIASSIQSGDVTSVLKDTIVGTYNFMSPEAIKENDIKCVDDGALGKKRNPCIKISRRSDVWSLGCILYTLTYGKTPFQHINTVFTKMSAITNPNYPIKYPPANVNIIAIIKVSILVYICL